MLYNLIQTRRGREKVFMTDTLPKINARMKALHSSQRKGVAGDKVTYSVKPTTETEKYRQKPQSPVWKK